MATVESNRTEQIISNFHLKALHLILQSRIPHLSQRNQRYQNESSSSNRPTKRDRWFNLAIGDHPAVLETLNFRNRGSISSDPMIIDVILSGGSSDPDSESILERWIVKYKRSNLGGSGGDVYVAYKKAIVLFRSMYSMLRLLPAYQAFRMLSSSNQNYRFGLSYKVSSFVETCSKTEDDEEKRYCFSPVETQFGQIAVSVTYRSSLAEFDLEGSPLMQPRIITDYVGSPAADPLKSFPSSLRSMSLHNQVESASFTRPHSWTSPAMAHHPSNRSLEKTASGFSGRQVPHLMLQKTQSSGSKNKGIDFFSEHKLSPPFSPSPTPSPPMYPNSPLRGRMHSETAPMSIPIPSRSSLPPQSPKSIKGDPGSAESPSDGRFSRKSEGFRIGELHSNLVTHTSQKGIRDGKDDQGNFSGIFSSCASPRVGFSRNSSRLSSQDFADDPELCCPFALDDIETSDSQNRNTVGKEIQGSYQPFMSSQDAAVGVLVQLLRSAPPLRHDPTYPSQSINSEHGDDVGSSCFYVSRKTSDALDELRIYKEMKDMLLSHSENSTPDSVKRSQKQHINTTEN